jgi:hypothetical protein
MADLNGAADGHLKGSIRLCLPFLLLGSALALPLPLLPGALWTLTMRAAARGTPAVHQASVTHEDIGEAVMEGAGTTFAAQADDGLPGAGRAGFQVSGSRVAVT